MPSLLQINAIILLPRPLPPPFSALIIHFFIYFKLYKIFNLKEF